MAELADDKILEMTAKGDIEIFKEIVLRHQSKILSLCYYMTKNMQEAEDLTQDVFMKALRSAGSFKGKSSVATWLHSIAANACINMINRKKKVRFLPLESKKESDDNEYIQELPDKTQNMDKQIDNNYMSEKMQKALLCINPNERAAIIQVYIEGRSYEEAALILGSSVGTLSALIYRGMAKLRKLLQAIGENDEEVSLQEV